MTLRGIGLEVLRKSLRFLDEIISERMTKQDKHLYEFGPFRIDTAERLLFRGQDKISLPPKAVDTLLALLSKPGGVLEKEELMKMIWGDSFVEDGGLARNVSLLRKVFGEAADDAQYIETIPTRGYRFVAPLKQADQPSVLTAVTPAVAAPPARSKFHKAWLIPAMILLAAVAFGLSRLVRTQTPGVPRVNSLVVLPMSNPSNDPKEEYFSEGMTEELINSLAKIEALRVISRTSAMTYKGANKSLPQIARELNVDAVVEGSVLQSGGRVRITVQLFEAKTERQLWAQSYEQDLRDVLALQNGVASAIAREIQVTLTPGEKQRLANSRTVDPEAYLAYWLGRYYWNRRTPEGFQKGIENFQRAIAKDPGYAPAHAGLADAYALLGSIGAEERPPREVMPKARAAAVEAVRLDETLAEGHASLGYTHLSYDWDLDAAEREFKRAIELNPGYATAHHWYAHYFLARAQPEQALAEMKKAQVLDPLSVIIKMGVGWCLYHGRRYDEAIAQYRTTLEMNPNFSLAHCALGMAYEGKKSYSDAIAAFSKAASLPGSHAFALAGLARAFALSGKTLEARRVLDQLEKSATKQYVPAVYLAAVYSAIGDKDRSILAARQAYDERSDYMVYLKTEPWADGLRPDARFQSLLQLVQPAR